MFTNQIELVKGKAWRCWSWLAPWSADLFIALLAVVAIKSSFAATLPGVGLLDFGSFVASAQAAQHGLDPYGIYPPLTWHVSVPGFEVWNQNLNPPISALLFQFFTSADPATMFRVWYLVNIVSYAAAIVLLVRRYQREAPPLVLALWALSLAGLWDALGLGQIYQPLMLASTIAWLLLQKGRGGWAGVLIGAVVAVKPNFAVWPVLLLLSGYRRPALISCLTAAAISLLPAVCLGFGVYRQWFHLIASDSGRAVFLTNASVAGLAARFGWPMLGLALSAGLLAAAGLWAVWRRRDIMDLSGIALVIALLAAPIAWVHYTVFLLPVVFANWRLRGMRLVALGLMVPASFIGHYFGQTGEVQLTLGSIYNWSLLLLLITLVREQLRKEGFLNGDHLPIRDADPSSSVSEPTRRKWIAVWAPKGPNLMLAIIAIAVIVNEFPRTLPGTGLLDFGSFVASGQAARDGLDPYGVYPLTFRVGPGVNPNLNPPISALLFQAFSLTEVHLMFRIWYVISFVLYLTVIVLLLRRYKETPPITFALVAFAMAGLWETLVLGQIYIPLVLAAVGAWLLLERGSMNLAGILIGIVVAIKPNFAVWPALLFLSGRFRPALVSGVTALGISAVPALVLGSGVYRQWFAMLAVDKGRAFFLTNAAISGLAARANLPLWGSVIALLLLAGAALWALVRRPSLPEVSTVALLLSVLASPIGWVNYALFLLPVFCARWSSPAVRTALALLMIPVPFIMAELPNPGFRQLTRGSIYNWALLLLLTAIVADQLREMRFFSRMRLGGMPKPTPAPGLSGA